MWWFVPCTHHYLVEDDLDYVNEVFDKKPKKRMKYQLLSFFRK
jgi:hypothetical protein